MENIKETCDVFKFHGGIREDRISDEGIELLKSLTFNTKDVEKILKRMAKKV